LDGCAWSRLNGRSCERRLLSGDFWDYSQRDQHKGTACANHGLSVHDFPPGPVPPANSLTSPEKLLHAKAGYGLISSTAAAASVSGGTRAAGECLLARRTLSARRCFLVELLHGFRGSR